MIKRRILKIGEREWKEEEEEEAALPRKVLKICSIFKTAHLSLAKVSGHLLHLQATNTTRTLVEIVLLTISNLLSHVMIATLFPYRSNSHPHHPTHH